MSLFDPPSQPTRPPEPDRVGPQPTRAQKAAATRFGNASEEVEAAKEMARLGDDSFLLPYEPTQSINRARPRTLAAGYSPELKELYVRFRDGTPWVYQNVSPSEWKNFRRVQSPGRYINRVLNNHPYHRGDF